LWVGVVNFWGVRFAFEVGVEAWENLRRLLGVLGAETWSLGSNCSCQR